MNNKGQVIFFTLMIAICILVLALAFAPVLKESTGNARTNMDCSNDSISIFDKTACLATDISLFSFIVGLIFIAGAIIGIKVMFE